MTIGPNAESVVRIPCTKNSGACGKYNGCNRDGTKLCQRRVEELIEVQQEWASFSAQNKI